MKNFTTWMKEAKDDILDYGFAIGTGGEDMIKSNAEENDIKLDDKAWDYINDATGSGESNILKLIKSKWEKGVDGIRDEGHGSTDELIGTIFVKKDSPAHKYIQEHVEDDAEPLSTGKGDFPFDDKDIYKGVKDNDLLGVMDWSLDFFKG